MEAVSLLSLSTNGEVPLLDIYPNSLNSNAFVMLFVIQPQTCWRDKWPVTLLCDHALLSSALDNDRRSGFEV